MGDSNKGADLKEKLKQALISTAKVISDDFIVKTKIDQKKNVKKDESFEIDDLNSKSDFIKALAEFDSLALKKKF